MKTKFITLVTSIIIVIFISCDDSTEPNNQNLKMSDYFPTEEGTWWVFNSYKSDSTGEWLFTGTDSVYMEPDKIIIGKTAYPRIYVSRYGGDVINAGSEFYALESSKLLTFNHYQNKWNCEIDLNKNELLINSYEVHIDSTYFDEKTGDSIRYFYDEYYDCRVIRKDDSILTIIGKNIPSIRFDFVTSWNSTIRDGSEMKTFNSLKNHSYWFGRDIGIIREETDDFEENGPRTKLELIDYYIKK